MKLFDRVMIVKSPNLRVRSPAPAVSAAATVIRFRGLEKSTLFSTQMRPAIAAIKPNSTIDKPPMTGPGIERIKADVDTAEAGGQEAIAPFGEQVAVGGHREVLDAEGMEAG